MDNIQESTIDNIQDRQSTLDNIQDSQQWTTYKTVNNGQQTFINGQQTRQFPRATDIQSTVDNRDNTQLKMDK